MHPSRAVRLPESFRGGCSFGAGIQADLSRRDLLVNKIGGKHGRTKAVNASRGDYQRRRSGEAYGKEARGWQVIANVRAWGRGLTSITRRINGKEVACATLSSAGK
jgi:hypothetical protein